MKYIIALFAVTGLLGSTGIGTEIATAKTVGSPADPVKGQLIRLESPERSKTNGAFLLPRVGARNIAALIRPAKDNGVGKGDLGPYCKGDLVRDGIINLRDLQQMVGGKVYGATVPKPGLPGAGRFWLYWSADLDDSGRIDLADLSGLLESLDTVPSKCLGAADASRLSVAGD